MRSNQSDDPIKCYTKKVVGNTLTVTFGDPAAKGPLRIMGFSTIASKNPFAGVIFNPTDPNIYFFVVQVKNFGYKPAYLRLYTTEDDYHCSEDVIAEREAAGAKGPYRLGMEYMLREEKDASWQLLGTAYILGPHGWLLRECCAEDRTEEHQVYLGPGQTRSFAVPRDIVLPPMPACSCEGFILDPACARIDAKMIEEKDLAHMMSRPLKGDPLVRPRRIMSGIVIVSSVCCVATTGGCNTEQPEAKRADGNLKALRITEVLCESLPPRSFGGQNVNRRKLTVALPTPAARSSTCTSASATPILPPISISSFTRPTIPRSKGLMGLAWKSVGRARGSGTTRRCISRVGSRWNAPTSGHVIFGRWRSSREKRDRSVVKWSRGSEAGMGIRFAPSS